MYSVKVCLRVRPMMPFEKARGDYMCIEAGKDSANYVKVKAPSAGGTESVKDFVFNMCFDENTTQTHFFESCGIQAMLDRALEGYAATVFAYGQTGSIYKITTKHN